MRKTLTWIGKRSAGAALLAHAGEGKPQIFRGEIGDTQCALNVHSLTRSHTEMLKSKKMGGTAAACATIACNIWEAILCCRRRPKSIVSIIRKR